MGPTIVWFQNDLRLADHPALAAAVQRGAVIPLFVWAPEDEAPWAPGSASRWWLHGSLKALSKSLHQVGSRLILRVGPTLDTLQAVQRETGADAVYWNRRYEPALHLRDQRIKAAMDTNAGEAKFFKAGLLFEPWELSTKSGTPYKVFTPFWKACQAAEDPLPPLLPPTKIESPERWPESLTLEDLSLLPEVDWAAGLRQTWTPGEAGARQQLDAFATVDGFANGGLVRYDTARDFPAVAGTSRLSPHLHHGELSPRQVWHTVNEARADPAFLRQLAWREFAYHLLYHFPHTPEAPLRENYARFPWRQDGAGLRAWQKGRTGYPIVDAGMRELWRTGWMHNRVRMIVASFLIKDLLIDWREGARWFWDTLVDADLANNTLGWQWAAGCGADAAPFFRIFNPVLQGQKFDAEGEYVRRWLLELERLPVPHLHAPWKAPTEALEKAGIQLGHDYASPIVDHAEARLRALEALAAVQ